MGQWADATTFLTFQCAYMSRATKNIARWCWREVKIVAHAQLRGGWILMPCNNYGTCLFLILNGHLLPSTESISYIRFRSFSIITMIRIIYFWCPLRRSQTAIKRVSGWHRKLMSDVTSLLLPSPPPSSTPPHRHSPVVAWIFLNRVWSINFTLQMRAATPPTIPPPPPSKPTFKGTVTQY